jgi:hypothetical protein
MIIQILRDFKLVVTPKHVVIFHFLRKSLNKRYIISIIHKFKTQRVAEKEDDTANSEVPGCSIGKVKLSLRKS